MKSLLQKAMSLDKNWEFLEEEIDFRVGNTNVLQCLESE
jgi:hypothetical protein